LFLLGFKGKARNLAVISQPSYISCKGLKLGWNLNILPDEFILIIKLSWLQ
jgi:hypothetical protein